jgi:hypothetical protein
MPPKNQPRYRKCYVSSCTTYTVKGLYIIPEHPVKRQPWIDACQFPANIPNSAKVCWKHFQKSDFKGDIDESECHFPRIHTGTVPSLLLPGSENEPETDLPILPDLPNCDVTLNEAIETSASNNPITVVNKYLRV